MEKSQRFDVGSRKQVFMDDRWFATGFGITLRVNPPVKAERVLAPEMPWESRGIETKNTILEHDGEYHLWYSTGAKGVKGFKHNMCYATSKDGVHFERRNVNLFEFDGARENNIIIPGGTGMVMLDPVGPEEHRFKMFISMAEDDIWDQAKEGVRLLSHEIHVATSPDGIHWELHKPAALPFCHDTNNQLFFDTRIQKYVGYVRTHEFGRTVSRVEVDDPLSLPFPCHDVPVTSIHARGMAMPPRGILHPVIFRDEMDPPMTDVYTPYVHQYTWAADAYFAFPSLYRHYPRDQEDDSLSEGRDMRGRFRNDGCLNVQLSVSRDGINWSRPDRCPYVAPGLVGAWDGASTYMVLGMIRKESEIWQYYFGNPYTHGRKDLHDQGWCCGLGRLVQRLDGFISADADYTGAEFITPVITFTGAHLKLNVDCAALGQVWVEIRDQNNLPIPGYTPEESIDVDRNQIAAAVVWKGKDNVGELIGKPVKLHFKLRACKLYAFQFED